MKYNDMFAIIGREYISVLHKLIDKEQFLLQKDEPQSADVAKSMIIDLIKNKYIDILLFDISYLKTPEEALEVIKYIKTSVHRIRIIVIAPFLKDEQFLSSLVTYGVYDFIILEGFKNERPLAEELEYQIDYLIMNPRSLMHVEHFLLQKDILPEKQLNPQKVEKPQKEPKEKWKTVFLVIVFLIFILLLGGLLWKSYNNMKGKPLEIEFTTNEIVEVEYGSKFDASSYVKKTNVDAEIILPEVDTTILGQQEILYQAKRGDEIFEATFIIKIIDSEPPTIELIQEEADFDSKKIYYKFMCLSQLKMAVDNVDGDITNKVECYLDTEQKGNGPYEYYVYKVQDSSGNEVKEVLKALLLWKEKGGENNTPVPTSTPKPTEDSSNLETTPSPDVDVKPTSTPTPTPTPTTKPSATPTPKPTNTPSSTPSSTPTPSVEPTASPTTKPTVEPTSKPSPTPTSTPKPSATPTPTPTPTPETHKHSYDLTTIVDAKVGENGYKEYTCSCGKSYRETIAALPEPTPSVVINGAVNRAFDVGTDFSVFVKTISSGVSCSNGAWVTVDYSAVNLNEKGTYSMIYGCRDTEVTKTISVIVK